MKDQIIMSKTNANCAVAVPLFRMSHTEELARIDGYTVSLTNAKPIAYAVDMGDKIQLFNAEFLEANVEFIGDL